MNRQSWVVYNKELKDMVRDRRMLVAAFSFALLGPVFMGIVFMLSQNQDASERQAHLAISNMQQAPGLVAFLEQKEIKPISFERGRASINTLPEGVDALLDLPKDYGDLLQTGQVVNGKLYVDEGSQTGIDKRQEISAAIHSYSSYVASIRLVARGVPVSLARPIILSTFDVAEESFITQTMSGMFLVMIIIASFIGGLSVAVDTLAGERERHTMQPLLAQPVAPDNIILGKLAMVSTFAIASTLLALGTFFFAISLVPAGILPIAIHLNIYTVSLMIVQLIPFAVFVAAIQLFISIQVKSFKEGQSYISMFMMLPMFLAYVKNFGADKFHESAFFLPILSEMESLGSLIFHGKADMPHLVSSILISVLLIYILVKLTAKKLKSEVMLDAA